MNDVDDRVSVYADYLADFLGEEFFLEIQMTNLVGEIASCVGCGRARMALQSEIS